MKMRTRGGLLASIMSLAVAMAAGDVRAEENEAAALYRIFLDDYAGKDGQPINVSRRAEAMTAEQLDELKRCTDGGHAWSPTKPVDDLGPAIGALSYVRLVDAEHWKPQDPGALIGKGYSVDRAVAQGMAAGLLTLSAVTFDASHRAAAFAYSFRCGALCANGGVVLLARAGAGWAISDRQCGMWMSKLDVPASVPEQRMPKPIPG